MAKIPKGLSDKDMLQGYVEQVTMAALGKPEKNIALTGFSDELVEELGRKLLELKMELFREGVKNYTLKVKKDGQTITIKPAALKNKR